MRRLRRGEEKPDSERVLLEDMNRAIRTVHHSQFYSKFRAYLFINFLIIALGLVILAFRFMLSKENDTMPAAVMCALLAAANAFVSRLLWKGVARRCKQEERGLVFRGFFATGIFVTGKILLMLTLILIPFARAMAWGSDYVYRYVDEGEHAGETVLMRYKLNGQLEDIYGNVYEE